jgi:predicted deacylase
MLKFGNVSVKPGDKKKFLLPVTKTPSGQDLGFPMMVVHGLHDGPVLLVEGAIHGDEYESGEAIRAIWRDLDPAKLHGVFVGVPVVNVPAFEAGRRGSIIDGINMNRILPGRKDGFLTEQLAYHYMREVVAKCDMGVDLHGGGTVLAISPVVIYREREDKAMEQKLRDLAYATGIDLIWKGGGAWGGCMNIEGPNAGIPVITAEVGGEGRCLEEFVQAQRKLIENLMMTYKMIPGTPETPRKRINVTGSFQSCSTGGLYRTKKQLRDRVKKGEVVGTICDLFGDILEEIKAPADGLIVSQRTFGTIHCGDWTIFVGAFADE